jgi:exonuclease SbcD
MLLVGNHDLAPALGRAHALDTFATLEVPHVRVLEKPAFLTPQDLGGLPLQVVAIPWVSRSGLVAYLNLSGADTNNVYEALEERLHALVAGWLERADPALPIVLTAHASVQGAKYGGERTVMLGNDLVLSGSFVRNPQFDYVALGHIHKPQNLNENTHPPVIYPGSIERVDFGEYEDEKFFVIAHVERGQTQVEWRQLRHIRPFISRYVRLEEQQDIQVRLEKALPPEIEMKDAIVRLILEYPRDWEASIDEADLRRRAASAFEFHLVKRPQVEARVRIAQDRAIGSMTHLELLDVYWRSRHTEKEDLQALEQIARKVIEDVHNPEEKSA